MQFNDLTVTQLIELRDALERDIRHYRTRIKDAHDIDTSVRMARLMEWSQRNRTDVLIALGMALREEGS